MLVLATFGPLVAIPLHPSTLAFDDRLLAGVVWLLCLLPSWRYLRLPAAKRPPIPFFPLIGFEFGAYFALQAVLGTLNLYGRSGAANYAPELGPELYHDALRMLFFGWSLLLIAYYVRSAARQRPPARGDSWNVRAMIPWAFALLGVGLVFDILRRLPSMPGVLRGILYFGSSFTLLAIALLTVLRVRRHLKRTHRYVLYGSMALLLFLQAGTSASSAIIVFILTVLFAVWIGGQRLAPRWAFIGVVGLLCTIAMRGVADEHRKTMGAFGENLPFLDRSTILFDILSRRLADEGLEGTLAGGWKVVSQRSALLDLFADVIRQTPEQVPFWGGQTYISLIGAAVPRVLWPTKPAKTLGQDFGHRYNYLAPNDYTTTVNMPFLIEFYANFGEIGVIIGMTLVGLIYATAERIVNVPGQSLMMSMVGLGLLLPIVGIEADFSLVFGGLLLNAAALFTLYRFARNSPLTRVRQPRAPARASVSGAPKGVAPAEA